MIVWFYKWLYDSKILLCSIVLSWEKQPRNRKRDEKGRWFSRWWPLLFTADCHNRVWRCRAVTMRQNQHGCMGVQEIPAAWQGEVSSLQSSRQELFISHRLRHFELCSTQSKAVAWLRSTHSWETLPVGAVQLNCLFLLSQPAERVMITTRSDDISPAASELAHRQVSSSPCLSLTGQLEQGHPEHPMGLGWGDWGPMAHGLGWGNARCCTALARTLLEEIGVY